MPVFFTNKNLGQIDLGLREMVVIAIEDLGAVVHDHDVLRGVRKERDGVGSHQHGGDAEQPPDALLEHLLPRL